MHTFGGGTWLSEFALQTGVPHDVFGPAGEFAPFNVAPHVKRSFVRSLKAAGYRTVALYPTRGNMMNGRAAYAGYGFDEFLDAAELGLPETWGTPDALVHEAARRVLARERQHDQPVFLFVETLFNHAEHGIHMERVPAALLAEAAADFPAPDEARSVADYLWRSRQFEREIALTRQAVLGGSRPAVLAWFGDHQPPFANAVTLRGRIRSMPTETGAVPAKYQTWYEVSSNRPGRLAQDTRRPRWTWCSCPACWPRPRARRSTTGSPPTCRRGTSARGCWSRAGRPARARPTCRRSGRTSRNSGFLEGLAALHAECVLGGDRAGERQLRPAGAGYRGGLACGSTALCSSGRGRAPELAARLRRSTQTAGASQFTKRAARAAPTPAVRAAPQRQPRRDAAAASLRRLGGWDKFALPLLMRDLASSGHRGGDDARGQRDLTWRPGLTRMADRACMRSWS